MYKVIRCGGRDLPLLANAATPYRYRQVFRKDWLITMSKITDGQLDTAEAVNAITELCYIMSAQADKTDMNRISEDTFITWCESWDYLDIMRSAPDILDVYIGNLQTDSKSKKKLAQLSEN